ncbi:MAG: transposase, partial [Candidatus Contendobacter sp.]
WVVERTFAWLSRYRRLVREYEKKPASSVAMIYVASIRIMLKKVLRRFLWSQPCRTPDLKPTN